MAELATSDPASESSAPHPEPFVRSPRPGDAAVGMAVIAVLVATAMRRSLPLANADSLLYALISTEELTFYYWGQDRLANLVPAIAWPVQQIEWNFLLQTAILATSFFALVGCFVWFHATRSDRPTSWPAITVSAAITGALTLALLSRQAVYDFVLVQQYALSMLLFLVGIHWVTGEGVAARVLGAVGILAGVLVIPSTVALAPVAAVIRRGPGIWKRTVVALVVSGVAFVIGTITPRLIYDGITSAEYYDDFSIARLRAGYRRTLDSIADSVLLWPAVLVGLVCVIILVLRRSRFDPALRRAYALCPVIAVVWVSVFSANRWIEINDFKFRYHFTAYAAGLFVMAGAVTEMVRAVTHRQVAPTFESTPAISGLSRLVVPVSTVVIAVSIAGGATVAVPAIEKGKEDATVARRYDVELLVGDYWRVWPAMFADRVDGGDALTVSFRSDPLMERIWEVSGSSTSVGVLCVDGDPAACLDMLETIVGGEWRIVSTSCESPLVLEVSQV